MKPDRRHIAVVGLMGSGKTTIGRLLAARMGLPLVDSDEAIEARYGRTGRELTSEEGLEFLHRAEAEHLLESLACNRPSVITPAASVFDRDGCVRALRLAAWVVWLDMPPDVLAQRMGRSDHRRSVVGGEIEALVARRRPMFERAADLVISDPGLDAEAIVDMILESAAQVPLG